MYLDAQLQVSAAQSLTGNSAILCAEKIDLQAATLLGAGNPVKVVVEQTASGGTTPTLLIEVIGADDSGLTSNVVVLASRQITNAEIGADKFYVVPCPGIVAARKQYYGVRYTQGGTSPTATVNAYFVADVPSANLV